MIYTVLYMIIFCSVLDTETTWQVIQYLMSTAIAQTDVHIISALY